MQSSTSDSVATETRPSTGVTRRHSYSLRGTTPEVPLASSVPPSGVEESNVQLPPVSPKYQASTNMTTKSSRKRQQGDAAMETDKSSSTVAVADSREVSSGSLKRRLGSILMAERMADVHFLIGETPETAARVPAHRLLLSISSPVFDAMFNSPLAVAPSTDVPIPDVDLTSFQALLTFIYTDQISVEAESVMGVLYTAKKYAVEALEERCIDFLRDALSKDNAFLLRGQARFFSEHQLAALCFEMIDRYTGEAMEAECFLETDLDTLCAVLRRDTLCIREYRLFRHILRWADAVCARTGVEVTPEARRRVLGGAMELIRFPTMTAEEFANEVAQTGVLEADQIVQMFLWFHLDNAKPVLPFSTTTRCLTAGRELTCSRFLNTEIRWGYSGRVDNIQFIVNRPIYIIGLGLYGSVAPGCHYNSTIQIIKAENREVRAEHEVEYDTDGSKKPVFVPFPEPIQIEPNTPYLACAIIRGPDSYYGTRGKSSVTIDLTTGMAVTSTEVATAEAVAASQPSPLPASAPIAMTRRISTDDSTNGGSVDTSMVPSSSARASSIVPASPIKQSYYSPSHYVTFAFSNTNSSNNGTSKDDGQIPEIVFYV